MPNAESAPNRRREEGRSNVRYSRSRLTQIVAPSRECHSKDDWPALMSEDDGSVEATGGWLRQRGAADPSYALAISPTRMPIAAVRRAFDGDPQTDRGW